MVTRTQVEREFDDLTKKIAQLETFRHELASLNTRGFETEARLIRSKLHDVTAIPAIAQELAALRKKIKERHDEKFHFNRVSNEHHAKTHTFERYRKLLEKKVERLEHDSHEKEARMRTHFKSDIHSREQILALRYKNLMKKLQADYEHRIQTELKKDVQGRIHVELQEKLDEEKRRMLAGLIHANAKKLAVERKNLALRLHHHYGQKEKKLVEESKGRVVRFQRKFRDDKIVGMQEKLAAARGKERELRSRLGKTRRVLAKERAALRLKLALLQAEEKKVFLAAHRSAREKERIAALKRANEELAKEHGVLHGKILRLKKNEERELAASHAELRAQLIAQQKKLSLDFSQKQKSLHGELAALIKQKLELEKTFKMRMRSVSYRSSTNAHDLKDKIETAKGREKQLRDCIRQARELFLNERVVLEQKLVQLKEEEKKVAADASQSAERTSNIKFSQSQSRGLFSHERAALLEEIVRLRKAKKVLTQRIEAKASVQLAAYKKKLALRYAEESKALHERLLAVADKDKMIGLQGKRLRSSIAVQRKQLHQRTEQIKAEVRKHDASASAAFAQKRVILQRLCTRLHHRVLDLGKREHEQAQKEADLRATLGREHERLHQQLHGVQEKKKKALSQAREQASAGLAVHQKELDARFAQQQEELNQKMQAVEKKEQMVVVERKKIQEALSHEQQRLQEKYDAMKADLEKSYMALAGRLRQEAEKRALDVSNANENLQKYRAKAATQFAQKNARLAVQSRELEKRGEYLARQEVVLRDQVVAERAALENKLAATKREEQATIKKIKADAQHSLDTYKKEASARFQHQLADIKQKTHTELRSALEAVKAQNEASLRKTLGEREQQLRRRLETEYQQKLGMAVRKHLMSVRKKKVELERQIVAQAREFTV